MKKSKGITLIALVITIIVLLILAGVTVGSLKGDNAIITKTKQAKEMSVKGGIIENAKIDILKKQKSKRNSNITEDELKQILLKYGTLSTGAGNINEETLTTKENYKIPVKDIYEVNGKTLVEAFDAGELKVGDYLDYNEYVSKTNGSKVANLSIAETGYGSEQSFAFSNTTKWRILGKEGDHLKLISGSPIKNGDAEQYLHLVGAEGWYHTNDELVGKENNILNRMCNELYSSDLAQEVRSVNIDDINSALGYTLQGNGMVDSGNNPVASFDGTIGYERKYYRGDYSPYNFLKEKYPGQYDSLVPKTSADSEIGTGYYYDIPQESNVINEILFKGTCSYWLASSSVFARSSFYGFGPGRVDGLRVRSGGDLFYSFNGAIVWHGVRPVVSLRSDTTINDLHKVDTASEKNWTGKVGYDYLPETYFQGKNGKILGLVE